MKIDQVIEGLRDPKDNPCWKGYKPVGTKKKGGRTVPNCVPKEGVAEGLGKTIKRSMAGWGAFDKDKPADVVKRVKGQDTDTLKGLSNRGSTGKGSPAELQQKAISRELKKRGEQGVAEGRHGYDDAGFSLAPGHDEGEPVYNPRYDRTGSYDRKSKSSQDYNYNTGKPLSTISQKKGYVFYNVNDEMTARKLGLKQTKSGKWFLPADDLRQDTADKVFGKGRYWEPKSESTNESVKKADAPKPRNFVAKNAKMGGAGQHKDKKKAQKQGDVKHKKPVYETGALKVQKDDDKATVLLNPATGVQTQIDKTNPNAPRLAQDEQGKLKLSMAQGAQSGGTEVKPNLVGKDVAIDTSPVEDVHRISAPGSQPGGEITDVNPRSPISGDEEHDEISKLLNQRLRKLAGL